MEFKFSSLKDYERYIRDFKHSIEADENILVLLLEQYKNTKKEIDKIDDRIFEQRHLLHSMENERDEFLKKEEEDILKNGIEIEEESDEEDEFIW
jgi:hypothetical protein